MSKEPIAYLENKGNVPMCFVHGKPHTGTGYMSYGPQGRYIEAIGKAGSHIYSFSANVNDMPYDCSRTVCLGPDEYDYSEMDERSRLAVENDPDALLMPLLFLGTPKWWGDAHPGECVVTQDDDGNAEPYMVKDRRMGSWASDAWREHTADALRRYIAYVDASDYADRIVGYQMNSGTTEEWMQWGSCDQRWPDYSAPNVKKFQSWLREKYGDESALQAAWRDADVTFDTAAIPAPQKRMTAEVGYLRDPNVAQDCIDYNLYTNWLVADTIAYFAKVAKEAMAREQLIGVYCGYVLQLMGYRQEQNSGHHCLRDLFTCPDVDFYSSPTSYDFRELGTGYPHIMSLIDSVKAHGKMWFNQNDYRTWLTEGIPVGFCGKAATYEGTRACLRREFAMSLIKREGYWWFDMGGGWYDDPRLLADIAQMEAIAADCIDVNGASVAEVAFVVDDKSSAYLQPGNPFSMAAVTTQLKGLGRMGAPYSIIHLADLDRAAPHKMYVFANCIAPSDEERRLIEEKVKRPGVAAVWIGPAGIYRDGQLDEAGMEALTGVPMKLLDADTPWNIMPTAAGDLDWRQYDFIGDKDLRGLLALPQVETPLGIIQTGKLPALGMVEQDGFYSIVAAAPPLPASLLNAIARKVGVHIYTDTPDIIWACEDLLAISVNEAGTRTIRLPRACTVVDLWTGKTVCANADSFDVYVPAHETQLYRLAD